MVATFSLLVDGEAADATLVAALQDLEVEENAELPGAIRITLGVSRTATGAPSMIDDRSLQPYQNLAVVVRPAEGIAECIFDGYVLSHQFHIERGLTNSTLKVWGQDASWLMNLEEKTREWVDLSDADVAGAVLGEYGFAAAAANAADESPSHPESGHSLMQRATDAQFLRELARRTGKLFRISCGRKAGSYVGWFARPDASGAPAFTLKVNDVEAWNVEALDFSWDVARPTAVVARQALFDVATEDGVDGGTTDSQLAPLDARALRDFAGRAMTVRLTATVGDAGELGQRARAVLAEAGWFVRCEGEADLGRLGVVPRVGTVAAVEGVGCTHSGNYLVWSVHHTIRAESHRVRFVLMRNAVGAAPIGGR